MSTISPRRPSASTAPNSSTAPPAAGPVHSRAWHPPVLHPELQCPFPQPSPPQRTYPSVLLPIHSQPHKNPAPRSARHLLSQTRCHFGKKITPIRAPPHKNGTSS